MDSDVTVRGVITREYVDVGADDPVRDAVRSMREAQASSVIVVDDGPVGIVTEWDVLGVVADGRDPDATPVSAVMSSPIRSVRADTSLSEAAGIMSGEGIRNLLVETRDGEVAGVLTDRDLIAAVASLQRTVDRPGPVEGGPPEGVGTDPGSPEAAGQGRTARERREAAGGTVADSEVEARARQGVCETCGSLADDLREVNGQLVCVDCRDL